MATLKSRIDKALGFPSPDSFTHLILQACQASTITVVCALFAPVTLVQFAVAQQLNLQARSVLP